MWEPPVLVPNDTIGVCTRAKKSLLDKFQVNADILEVLQEISSDATILLSDLRTPKSQHTVHNMATQNLNGLKYQHDREQSKNKKKPQTLNPMEANPDLYEVWDTSQYKWVVLVPN